jgi:hypothetical protein
VSRTAPETAVTAAMLTKLRVAIDTIDAALEGDELIFEVLRFVFFGVVFAAMAIPKEIAGQGPFSRLTLTLSLSRFVPDLKATMA